MSRNAKLNVKSEITQLLIGIGLAQIICIFLVVNVLLFKAVLS
jgi:hypothetical protein